MGGPNKHKLLLLSTVLLFLCHTSLLAEGASNGKEFYVAFSGNVSPGSTYDLYVTTHERQPVSFTINAPGTGYSANGMVQYGEVATFEFEASEYELRNTSDRGKAIIVRAESNRDLTVYGGNLERLASDSFLSLPKQPDQGQSTYKYIVVSYDSFLVDIPESFVAIIAQYDDTLLSITPKVDTVIGTTLIPAGTTANIALQEAETFLIVSTDDLTGLAVVSNRPLAVLSGHECTNVPSSVNYCDHLVEQVPPVSSWGRQFATAPRKGRQAYNVFRVLASECSTEVVVNCTSSNTTDPESSTNTYQLGEGSFVEFNVPSDQYCFIQGSANILVLQYSVGRELDGMGDPSMSIVPAITQYCNQYSLPTIQSSDGSINFTNYLNIFIPVEFYQLDQVFLDNQPLNNYSLTFTAIEQDGNPQVYAAQVDLTEGVHTLNHTNPAATLGVIVYGLAFGRSYGHPGGLQLTQEPLAPPTQLTVLEISPTSFTVSWRPPLGEVGNGSTLYYLVNVTDTEKESVVLLQHTVNSTALQLRVAELLPDHVHQVAVAAVSGEEIGPAVTVWIKTSTASTAAACTSTVTVSTLGGILGLLLLVMVAAVIVGACIGLCIRHKRPNVKATGTDNAAEYDAAQMVAMQLNPACGDVHFAKKDNNHYCNSANTPTV